MLALLLALFVQPLVEDRAHVFLVRLLGGLAPPQLQSLQGTWFFVWCREGEELTRDEEVPSVRVQELGRRATATFAWKERQYRLIGKRASDVFLTGTYDDFYRGRTFHGAFQLSILPGGQLMSGKWIGFNSQNEVISGPWEWRRESKPGYPFERRLSSSGPGSG